MVSPVVGRKGFSSSTKLSLVRMGCREATLMLWERFTSGLAALLAPSLDTMLERMLCKSDSCIFAFLLSSLPAVADDEEVVVVVAVSAALALLVLVVELPLDVD